MPDSTGAKRKEPAKASSEEAQDSTSDKSIVKRARQESNEVAISQTTNDKNNQLATVPRTSALDAPNLKLTGHSAAVNSAKFDPSGTFIASGSFDKTIFIWKVFEGCENTAVLEGHKNSIQEVAWLTTKRLCAASADKTVTVWDVDREFRLRKFSGHDSFVNSCCNVPSENGNLVASASDDGTVQLWDVRKKGSGNVATFAHTYQVTSVCASKDGNLIFTGGLDNVVRAWDIRKESTTLEMVGHADTITSLRTCDDGNHVLSSSMDGTLRFWDIRPFVPNEQASGRCSKVFGDPSSARNIEKALIKASASKSGQLVACGSPSRRVCIWDTFSTDLLYDLPGHTGTVMEVDFHPDQPIVVSCSSDRTLYVGEIAPTSL